MSDYKYHNSTVEGSCWKRASSILIYNDMGQVPRVAFGEQVVVDVGGEVFTRDVGTLNVLVDENVVAEVFKVLDAEGEETGTEMSVGQLAAMITSAYVHFADKRDHEDKEALEDEVVETDGDIPDDIPGEPNIPTEGEGDDQVPGYIPDDPTSEEEIVETDDEIPGDPDDPKPGDV